ncbi:MAG: TonB-dependent receptor, partial [Flavobacteriales bacterium]|nr:TonB-dependent receptor [Flavobacteriales bacterium]
GQVLNTSNESLAFSTVVVLQVKDSSMYAFGMTNEDGLFKIELSEKGDYLLQYSYVGYTSFYKALQTDWASKKIEIPTTRLQKSTTLLKEVNVETERVPMGIKGDTIVYDAKAFKTRDGATVEDLLKKLPGIQIAKDGSIKAQGKEVNKVLVDGKEFFGNDPKIATKNLEAEAIDKVELFDKKSEVAEFTGVDDGQEERTINLKLKEDYKKGAFGRLTAAVGTQNTHKGKINYNLFNTQSQLSIIGNSNNVNEQAFSLQDYMDFMGGIGNISNINSGVLSSGFQSDQGINTGNSIGSNLNHSFNEKLSLNANYFYLRNNRNLQQGITSENFSEQSRYESIQSNKENKINQNHRINTKLKWKINPFTAFSFYNNLRGLDLLIKSQSDTYYSSINNPSTLTTSKLSKIEQQFSGDSKLLFKKKFQKKGRNWISSFRYEQAFATQTNDLSNNSFGQGLIQFQDFNTKVNNQRFASTYTEPIAKKWYGSIAYEYNRDWANPIRDFYDIVEEKEILNTQLSGDFSRLVRSHTSSMSIRRNSKKLKLSGALGSENIQLNTVGLSKAFHYILPSASLQWKLKNAKNIDASYNTNINIPSLAQLISIPNNIDPNRNYIGNSNLNPEYVHRLSVRFNFFDNFNFSSVFLTLIAQKIENKIVEQTQVNPDLTISASPVNTNLYESISSFVSVSQPIKQLRIVSQLRGSSMWSRYNAWLNGEATQISEQNYSANFSIERKKKEKWDYRIGLDLSWTKREYAINRDFDQNFANYSWYIDLDWEPREDLLFTVSYTMKRYNDVFFSAERQLHFIDASVRKAFKNNKWAIKLSANDILNQTIGISRSGTDNSLSEERFNTRAQYFMLEVSCKLGNRKKKEQ